MSLPWGLKHLLQQPREPWHAGCGHGRLEPAQSHEKQGARLPFLALADRILSARGGGSETTVASGGEHPTHVAMDASLKIAFAETRFRR